MMCLSAAADAYNFTSHRRQSTSLADDAIFGVDEGTHARVSAAATERASAAAACTCTRTCQHRAFSSPPHLLSIPLVGHLGS